MSRTILYYPDIQIPTAGEWISKALLYWDQVAAIVPRSYHGFMDARGLERYRPEIRELLDAGVFRPVDPNRLFTDGNPSGLEADIKRFIRSARKNIPERIVCDEAIYRDKASKHVFHLLVEAGLAEDRGDKLLYFFEHQAACVYMALLAKHMAAADSHTTVPGTNRESICESTFGAAELEEANIAFSGKLDDILPVPRPDVPLGTILKFRTKYQSELLAFRAAMDAFEQSLANESDIRRVPMLVTAQREKIVRECIELSKALGASKIKMTLGSLQAFIKPNSPALIETTAVLAGKAANLTTVPVSYVAAGAAVAGAIAVAAHLVGKIEERREKMSNSPFTYVFLAQKKLAKK